MCAAEFVSSCVYLHAVSCCVLMCEVSKCGCAFVCVYVYLWVPPELLSEIRVN